MLTNTYVQIRQLLPYLTNEEREQLVEELKSMVEDEQTEPPHSIMKFMGIGEELWKGIDVETYLKDLRSSQR